MKNIIALFVFALCGISLGVYGGLRVQRALASDGWPTVEGSIIQSSVDSVSGRRGASTSEVKMSYRYQVDGKWYDGDVVSFRTGGGGRNEAQAVVARFPAGSKAQVHYNPSDPAIACLDPGSIGWRDAVMTLVGLGVAGAAGYAAANAIRARGRTSKAPAPIKKKAGRSAAT